jgi:ribosomal protein L18
MDTAKLRALIDSDAANATKTAQQIADWCNARVMAAPVPAQDVAQYLVAAGLLARIEMYASAPNAIGTAMEAKALAAKDMMGAITLLQSFDLSVPAYLARITAALDTLIEHGLMSPTHKAQILALGDNRRSRAEAAGLGEVWGLHVASCGRGVL